MSRVKQIAAAGWLSGMTLSETTLLGENHAERQTMRLVWIQLDNQMEFVTIRDRNPLDVRGEKA